MSQLAWALYGAIGLPGARARTMQGDETIMAVAAAVSTAEQEKAGTGPKARACPVCEGRMRNLGARKWRCAAGHTVTYRPPLGRSGVVQLTPGQARCVLKHGCGWFGSEQCARCLLPDETGRLLCPECRSRLFFLEVRDDSALWGCSNLPGKGCGATISRPLPGAMTLTEQERARAKQAALDAESEDEERAYRARRRRERRTRQKAKLLAGPPWRSGVSAERVS